MIQLAKRTRDNIEKTKEIKILQKTAKTTRWKKPFKMLKIKLSYRCCQTRQLKITVYALILVQDKIELQGVFQRFNHRESLRSRAREPKKKTLV